MISWITGTVFGKFISTFFISMLPVVELRAGLPYGIALGLDYPLALTAAVVGNMIPVPFIVIYIRKIFMLMRKHMPRMDSVTLPSALKETFWSCSLPLMVTLVSP